MFQCANVHLSQMRTSQMCINQQANVHPIAIFKTQLLQQHFLCGNDAAKRLTELDQLREKQFEHGFGRQLSHAPALSTKTAFHKISLTLPNGLDQIADDVGSQTRQITVQIRHHIAMGGDHTILHRCALAQHRASDHRRTCFTRQCRRIIDGTVVNHNHFSRDRISQGITHHIGDSFGLIEGWDDHTDRCGGQRQDDEIGHRGGFFIGKS